jgi:L,D-peptidoglycan transpeptidase YkuD (ErfK/YbiS/YcfS/YnhG family)
MLLISIAVMMISCSEPPTGQRKRAMDLRTECILADAELRAGPEFIAADSMLSQAEQELAIQQDKFKPLRDYAATDSLYKLAGEKYITAGARARDSLTVLKTETDLQLKFLERELTAWRTHLDTNLVVFPLERFWSDAQMRYEDAVGFQKSGNSEAALEQIQVSRAALDSLTKYLIRHVQDEATLQSTWANWISETLAESAIKKDYALIVEKSAHQTHLVHKGKIIRRFNCELGFRPAKQKLFAGDGATPEGRYRISKVNANSKYYRALVLDYPNKEDKKRYKDNRSNGIIPNGRGIGSLIELHGHGGQGKDWTEGCVALSDQDMDTLLQYANLGTAVTIVRRWPDKVQR